LVSGFYQPKQDKKGGSLMKKIMILVGCLSVAVVLFMLTGCASPVQSRVMSANVAGKNYEMQVKGTGGAGSNDLTLNVNGNPIAQANLMPVFAGAKILSGEFDKILFEADCNVTTTANGWGAIRRCLFYADKKAFGESSF
jgi:hypothetical protein